MILINLFCSQSQNKFIIISGVILVLRSGTRYLYLMMIALAARWIEIQIQISLT
jgi:hypothetical protein